MMTVNCSNFLFPRLKLNVYFLKCLVGAPTISFEPHRSTINLMVIVGIHNGSMGAGNLKIAISSEKINGRM